MMDHQGALAFELVDDFLQDPSEMGTVRPIFQTASIDQDQLDDNDEDLYLEGAYYIRIKAADEENPRYLEPFDRVIHSPEQYRQLMQDRASTLSLSTSQGMMQSVVTTTVNNMVQDTPVMSISPFAHQ